MSMYPEEMVRPFRTELTEIGFEELKTAEAVENHLNGKKGTTLLFINSVCGCAARSARPAVAIALHHSSKKPDHLVTVFAGADIEATKKAREYTMPFPPSSPSIALFRDGELVHFIERHHIEGRPAEVIADHLMQVFEELC